MRIGIDLGGTKTEGIVMDDHGNIVQRLRRPTPASEGYYAVVDNIVNICQALNAPFTKQLNVGIGTPGSLIKNSELMKNCNTVCLNDRPLQSDLSARLQRPVRIANDANCFALSEAVDGAGQHHDVVFGVILGTGVGGGVVINNQVLSGPNHLAGEWGHNVFKADGLPCYCGKRGCVETELCGPALVRRYQQAGGDAADAATLMRHYRANAAMARDVFDEYVDDLARALATVVNIIDPDMIVLGGGISNIDELYADLPTSIQAASFGADAAIPVLKNRHGDSSGVRGAAWLWP